MWPPSTPTNSAVRSGHRPCFRPSKGLRSGSLKKSLRHNDFFSAACLYPVWVGLTLPARTQSHLATGGNVNKAELIEALSARLGDKKQATSALDAVLAEIQSAVTKGDKVAITGFGVFEKRVRGARTARNPRTGEAVKVKKTSVPAFRAGASFREMVASGKVPKATPAKKTAATKTATATKSVTAKAAPAK